MNQILVRMRKAKKPTGAKSQQDLPFQARGKGITKMMAMETNNLVPGMLMVGWSLRVPCEGFSCRMLFGGSLLCRSFRSFLEESCPNDSLEIV
jgi:hypothetical protein